MVEQGPPKTESSSADKKELQFIGQSKQYSLVDPPADRHSGSDDGSQSEKGQMRNHRSMMVLSADHKQGDKDISGIHIESDLNRSVIESWEEIESSVGDSFIHPDDLHIRKWIFFFFILGNFWLAFDNGIIPACQIQMMEDLNISQGEIAFLSSAVNIGLAIAALIVAPIMTVAKTKSVLVISYLVNSFASGLFAFSTQYAFLTFARFLLGFT